MKNLLWLIALIVISSHAFALEDEVFYSDKWCVEKSGQYKREETRVLDMYGPTYPDCVLEREAVETDWAYKWYEGVGQALHYARMTNKEPAVLLLLKTKEDEKYLQRLIELQSWLNAGAAKVNLHVYYVVLY